MHLMNFKFDHVQQLCDLISLAPKVRAPTVFFSLRRPPPSTFGHKFGAKLLTGLSRRNERISWDELSGEVEKKNAAGGNLVFFGFIVAAYVFFS